MNIKLDRESLLACVDGDVELAAFERVLNESQLTLALEPFPSAMTVRLWLDAGAPGARNPWLDPADHLVAGLNAVFPDGRVLNIRPAPRRAVGPDTIALIVGMHGRFARVTRAWLRVHPIGAFRPTAPPFTIAPNPPLTPSEAAMLEALDSVFRITFPPATDSEI